MTIDIAGLAIKSGNCAVLRGGSAAENTNKSLIGVIQAGLEKTGLTEVGCLGQWILLAERALLSS